MGDECTREELLVYAKIAEQAERYEDMVEFMDKVVRMEEELTREERNLLSVAHKNVVGARRSSFRVVRSKGSDDQVQSNDQLPVKTTVVTEFDDKIKEELEKKCDDIVDLLDTFLIDNEFSPESDETADSDKTESQVFYLKMKGDYNRYLFEVKSEKSERDKAAEESRKAYLKATEIAKSGLTPTNPIRLGLALNFSVFYYEIEGNNVQACSEAKCAFDEAIAQLDGLSENSYKDSTLIMQLLRDNLTLWTSDEN